MRDNKPPYLFAVLYALIYMGNAVYNPFMPVYLDNIGLSRTAIGTLTALGPLVGILAQPVWGLAGDRARTKNLILKILLAGSTVTIILFPLSTSFPFLFFMISVFMFFQTPVYPLSDAITLEHLENTRWKFGPVRMAGTIGFSVMSAAAGFILKNNVSQMFLLYFAVLAATVITTFGLPEVKGYQSSGTKVSVMQLFRNREMVLLLLFSFFFQMTMGFYAGFFPIHYRQIGGDNVLLGWIMFIAAASEIPFLLFVDRILARVGIKVTLAVSTAVTGVRWLLVYLISDIYVLQAVSLLHGFSFIVFTYSLAVYINKEAPKELRASGQALNGLVGMGVARMAGSILGGVFSDAFGIRSMFLWASLLNFAAVLVFGYIFIFLYRTRKDFPDQAS